MNKSGSKNGRVYLVGAGPGDLGLVTLRAKECIENADVIVYDHLANPDTLGWARDNAETIYAGKQPGESRTQEEITSLLIEKAREGKQVVRLKGGDPFVFAEAQKKPRKSPVRESRLKLCLESRRPSPDRLTRASQLRIVRTTRT